MGDGSACTSRGDRQLHAVESLEKCVVKRKAGAVWMSRCPFLLAALCGVASAQQPIGTVGVQDATVAKMARVLRRGGEFRFVSDIDDYCAWTLSHLARSDDFAWTAERAIDWRQPWDGYTMTRYGRKAEREGRVAAYLRFQRV